MKIHFSNWFIYICYHPHRHIQRQCVSWKYPIISYQHQRKKQLIQLVLRRPRASFPSFKRIFRDHHSLPCCSHQLCRILTIILAWGQTYPRNTNLVGAELIDTVCALLCPKVVDVNKIHLNVTVIQYTWENIFSQMRS